MRILGGLLFLIGAAATAYSVWGSFNKRRPVDVLLGLASPIALLISLTGALLLFVPDFFS